MRAITILITVVFATFTMAIEMTRPIASAQTREAPPAASPTSTAVPSLDAMPVAAVALFRVSEAMEATATLLDESASATGDPALAVLATHWRSDAETLRELGNWLFISVSADSMVHDPDKAHELNLENLKGNGEVMIAQGKAMIRHGEEMTDEATSLRESGVLPTEIADRLTADAAALVTAGKQLERDGTEMRDYAENMLRSIGQ